MKQPVTYKRIHALLEIAQRCGNVSELRTKTDANNFRINANFNDHALVTIYVDSMIQPRVFAEPSHSYNLVVKKGDKGISQITGKLSVKLNVLDTDDVSFNIMSFLEDMVYLKSLYKCSLLTITQEYTKHAVVRYYSTPYLVLSDIFNLTIKELNSLAPDNKPSLDYNINIHERHRTLTFTNDLGDSSQVVKIGQKPVGYLKTLGYTLNWEVLNYYKGSLIDSVSGSSDMSYRVYEVRFLLGNALAKIIPHLTPSVGNQLANISSQIIGVDYEIIP